MQTKTMQKAKKHAVKMNAPVFIMSNVGQYEIHTEEPLRADGSPRWLYRVEPTGNWSRPDGSGGTSKATP